MTTKYRLAGLVGSTISAKLLYLMLLDLTPPGGKVQLSQRRVSEVLGISKTTVRRNFHRLKCDGHINIMPVYHNDGGRAANQFVVLG